MNHRSNWVILFLLIVFTGCSQQHSPETEEIVFKGKVVQIQHRLGQGYTLLIDSEGKTIRLEGYVGVPLGEVEIYRHGQWHYEVFQTQATTG